jgi:hypothetical protein
MMHCKLLNRLAMPFVKPQIVRRGIPFLLIGFGVWGLAGCFYVPVREHVSESFFTNTKEKDFRELLGNADSNHPLRPGMTRAQVLALLGPSVHQSPPDQLLYTLVMERAVWFEPLCFRSVSAAETGYALRLTFDANEVLVRWELAHVDIQLGSFISEPPGWSEHEALDELQNKGSSSSATLPATQP